MKGKRGARFPPADRHGCHAGHYTLCTAFPGVCPPCRSVATGASTSPPASSSAPASPWAWLALWLETRFRPIGQILLLSSSLSLGLVLAFDFALVGLWQAARLAWRIARRFVRALSRLRPGPRLPLFRRRRLPPPVRVFQP